MAKKPFMRVEYINKFIYKGNLLENRTALITDGAENIT